MSRARFTEISGSGSPLRFVYAVGGTRPRFLHELAALYQQREHQRLLMQEWSATGQDDGASAELLEAPTP